MVEGEPLAVEKAIHDMRRTSYEAASKLSGTVKFFNKSKGFGFISKDGGGKDLFVHISDVEKAGWVTLNEGQRVKYDIDYSNSSNSKAINLESA